MKAKPNAGLVLLLLTVIAGVGIAQDSVNVRIVEHTTYWRSAEQIAFRDSMVYVADEDAGLFAVNVANAARPQITAHYPVSGPIFDERACWGVAVNGTYLYAAQWNTMDVYSLQSPGDPAHPAFQRTIQTLEAATLLERNPLLLVRGFDTNAEIWNIADGAQPVQVGTVPLAYYYEGDATNRYWYMPDVDDVAIVDMLDPSQPVEAGRIQLPSLVTSMAVHGNYLFVGTVEGVKTVDVTDAAHPSIAASYGTLGSVNAVRVFGDRGYLSTADGMVKALDVADPTHAALLGEYAGASGSQLLAVNGARGYVSTPQSDMAVAMVDFEDPASPQRIGSFGEMGPVYDYEIVADTAYLLTPIGLRISVLENGRRPQQVAWIPVLGSMIYVTDGYAYIVSANGLGIVDVHDALHPRQAGILSGFLSVVGLAKKGNYLYVFEQGEWSTSIRVVNVADADHPASVSTVYLNISCAPTDPPIVRGNILYLCAGQPGISLLSLADSTVPSITGALPGESWDAVAVGNMLYSASPSFGLTWYDVSDPTAPQYVGQSLQFGYCYRLAANSRRLLCGNTLDRTWHLLDVSDSLQPAEIGSYGTTEAYGKPRVLSDSTYALAHDWEFVVYGCTAPSSAPPPSQPLAQGFGLRECYPNPFNPSTTIQFSLPRMERATLTIYDVEGRVVKVLSDGVMSAGEHQVMFDGSALSSGMYFARLEAGKNVQTQKMMLLK